MRSPSSRFLRPLAVLLAAGVLFCTGCAAAWIATGAVAVYGVISYSANGAEQDFRSDLPTTWAATVTALRALQYPVAEDAAPGSTEGRIESKDVTVVVERHTAGFTRVRVCVGTFDTDDHRRRAELVLQEVARNLPADAVSEPAKAGDQPTK